jgi:hypothetical protein
LTRWDAGDAENVDHHREGFAGVLEKLKNARVVFFEAMLEREAPPLAPANVVVQRVPPTRPCVPLGVAHPDHSGFARHSLRREFGRKPLGCITRKLVGQQKSSER